jgi:signal transduction histidine kinase
MVSGFANQASLALELTEARIEQQRAAVADDRDRIAADLHDHVIQRLFAAGLSLQSVAKQLGTDTPAGERIAENITNLDQTISQIRTTIFQLNRATGAVASGLRGRVLDVLADVTPALGFSPETRFTGPLQASVPDDIGEDLLAVLREALSNIARHANARCAAVEISVHDALTLRVVDDGVGLPATTRRSGLANMAARAERHGGSLHVARGDRAGTTLSWTVPIS